MFRRNDIPLSMPPKFSRLLLLREAVCLIENNGAAASGYFHTSLWSRATMIYSYRRATIGSIRIARRAGM